MSEEPAVYRFRHFYIPPHMMEALQRYIEKHEEVGDFLRAVISNDLCDACSRADDENIAQLPAFVGYLYNKAPQGCWGSKEAYRNWTNKDVSKEVQE
jgi:hypothetical protein